MMFWRNYLIVELTMVKRLIQYEMNVSGLIANKSWMHYWRTLMWTIGVRTFCLFWKCKICTDSHIEDSLTAKVRSSSPKPQTDHSTIILMVKSRWRDDEIFFLPISINVNKPYTSIAQTRRNDSYHASRRIMSGPLSWNTQPSLSYVGLVMHISIFRHALAWIRYAFSCIICDLHLRIMGGIDYVCHSIYDWFFIARCENHYTCLRPLLQTHNRGAKPSLLQDRDMHDSGQSIPWLHTVTSW